MAPSSRGAYLAARDDDDAILRPLKERQAVADEVTRLFQNGHSPATAA
jgi:hypothetical protein